jgi:tetratricopeptide (TPR) repeat protein
VAYDDNVHIYENPLFAPINPAHIKQMWTQPYGNLYIPVAYTIYGILTLIAGRTFDPTAGNTTTALVNPHIFHIAGLLFHIANSLLVYFLIKRIVRKATPALVGALIFALHPVQVEAVCWAAELRGLSSTFFGLAAMFYMVKSQSVEEPPRAIVTPELWKYAALTVCAMLCKPSAIVFPFLTATLQIGFMHLPHRRVLLQNAIVFALLVPFALVTALSQTGTLELPGSYAPPRLLERPLIALDTLGFYVEKILLAVPNLLDYGRTPSVVMADHLWIGTSAIAIIVIAAAFTARRRYLPFTIGMLWMGIALLPVLGVSPFIFQYYSTVADRYLYMPMVGLAIAVAGALSRVRGRAPVSVALAASLALGFVSHADCATWLNGQTLFSHEVAVRPESLIGLIGIGSVDRQLRNFNAAARYDEDVVADYPNDYRGWDLYGDDQFEMGNFGIAMASISHAVSLHHGDAACLADLGQAEAGMGSYDQAIGTYRSALSVAPSNAIAIAGIGAVLQAEGSDTQAESWLRREIALYPSQFQSRSELGSVLEDENRLPDAALQLTEACKLNPISGPLDYDAGRTLEEIGQIDTALNYLRQAIALDPTIEPAYVSLGVCLAHKLDYADAASAFATAVHLRPTDNQAQSDLAAAKHLLGEPSGPPSP